MSYEIEKILVLSTKHLSEATCNEWMPECPWSCFEKGDYGWFIYVADPGITEEQGVPLELRSALHAARKLGCAWVMFDRDGDVLDELPEFDW